MEELGTNPSIIGDAILPRSATIIIIIIRSRRQQRSVVSTQSKECYEIDENVQFGIWRPAVAPSDAEEKSSNICAQLQLPTCTTTPKTFWKISFLITGAYKLVHSEPFSDYLYDI